jgi:hypothetical protein
VIADLDTLLTALYVELTDRIIPARGFSRRGPGKPPEVTDAELVCLAVAQVLLRYDDERHWLRAARRWMAWTWTYRTVVPVQECPSSSWMANRVIPAW